VRQPVFFDFQYSDKTVFINLADVSRVEVKDGGVTVFMRNNDSFSIADKTEAKNLIGILESGRPDPSRNDFFGGD
jgi:hypothetical protein